MYSVPKNYERLLDDLKPDLGDYSRLLVDVEIGFTLLHILRLRDEPVVVLWVILSGTPLRHPRLQNMTGEQQHALANARLLLPGFAGRFGWERALRDYIEHIPRDQRRYEFDVHHLDQQIVDAADQGIRHPSRETVYEECLSGMLLFKERSIRYAEEGRYEFTAYTSDSAHAVAVHLTNEHAALAQAEMSWFDRPRSRDSFSVRVAELGKVAAFLDMREGGTSWTERHQKIRYRAIAENGALEDVNAHPICLDGMTHIVGMVGAYKSTLMILLAAHAVWSYRVEESPQQRCITLVVGDTLTAIRLANQFNHWFCDDPETDAPIAVPLLGRTTRDTHLQRFYASEDYQTHLDKKRLHWAERWLNSACPLQAHVPAEQLQHQSIVPGKEPCVSLIKATVPGKTSRYRHSYMCPFFGVCPSQQLYRDMPSAQIWVTTPGALGAASLPPQLEKRGIRLGELVYEQSDIVVFDEVDTLIEWFDRLYAEEVLLAAGGEGILDDLDLRTTAYWTQNRIAPPPTSRWIGAQRQSLTAVSQLLSLLDESQGYDALRQWVSRGYFTALNLFYRLSRRLMGLKDFEDETDQDVIAQNHQTIAPILSVFDEIMNNDPLMFNGTEVSPLALDLAGIMKDLMTVGASPQNPAIIDACQDLILRLVPDVREKLEELRTRLSQSEQKYDRDYEVDTLETLAYRLEFALNAVLLDRHTRIVFYEWHNRPTEAIDGEQPYNHIPSGLMDILPVPPTGRLFGTYYSRNLRAPEDEQQRRINRLSTFGYTNIGRSYVRFFHNLRTAIDGQRGPNVLALSGTSYLPDSSRWHFDVPPQGILEPEHESIRAIAQSQFTFLPVYNAEGNAVRVSGLPNKMLPIKQLISALVGDYKDRGGYLGVELQRLGELAQHEPEYWYDRERLLLIVNSYEQARWAADEIRARWPEMRDAVFNLTQSASDDADGFSVTGNLGRSDVESFAETGGRILVAPMLSIGRGLNILNRHNKAAFGTIYFLTRPMPHPYDTQAIAQEINRRTYDWYNNPDEDVWQEDGVYQRGIALRKKAHEYWRDIEGRDFYANLSNVARRDLAATTAGRIVQATGRLVRGGVPFHAFFVDAAWSPRTADRQNEQLDTPKSSLLAAVIEVLADYTQDVAGHALYQPLFDALDFTENFDWQPEPNREMQDK